MTDIIQVDGIAIKRKTSGAGNPAASELVSGELLYNEADKTLVVGAGQDANGKATSIIPLGSEAIMAFLANGASKAYVDQAVGDVTPVVGAGLALLSGTNQIGLGESIALAGAPTAATPADNDSSDRLATTSFVMREMTQMLGASPAEFQTIQSIFNFASENKEARELLASAVANKLSRDANLSDLVDKAQARINLGLKSMAEQAANAVNITGGTIVGVTITGVISGGTV